MKSYPSMAALEADLMSGECTTAEYAGQLAGIGPAAYFIVRFASSDDRIARVAL